MKLQSIALAVSLIFSSAATMAENTATTDPRPIVRTDFKVRMKFDKCATGETNVTELPRVLCKLSLGTTLPENRKDYKIIKWDYIGDSYFDVEAFVVGDVIGFSFRDDWSEDSTGEKFYKEIKEYFDKNEVYYTFTYEGPDLGKIEGLGECVDALKD